MLKVLPTCLAVALVAANAWAQLPAGAEFQVNSYTPSEQIFPAAASDANGNFVVVWNRQDGSSLGVFGQRFNAAGLPQGREFLVNSYTTGSQAIPAVAAAANGNFVVVWQSDNQDGSYYGVFGQRFNAAGLPQGGEFQVNSFTTSFQRYPAVASGTNGNFVVVWESDGQDGSGWGVFGQRFNASGVPQGGLFRANTYTAIHQKEPAVSSDANGNFVVVWTSVGQDGDNYGVFGQRFHAFGLPLESEFQINSYTTHGQRFPAVASDANGNFVAVWQSYRQDGSGYGVFGQRFNASGVPQGGNFRANTNTDGSQGRPAVSSDANRSFVVAWQSLGQDGSGYGVFGQGFTTGGLPQGPEFQVNSYTTSNQYFPAVASAANGNFIAVWNSFGQDGSAGGIFGQRYGDLIFADGFDPTGP